MNFHSRQIYHIRKRTTLFRRPSDVYNIQMTLDRRQNNVLC